MVSNEKRNTLQPPTPPDCSRVCVTASDMMINKLQSVSLRFFGKAIKNIASDFWNLF